MFFFTQNTANEMRISYWSSDVCSSDLQIGADNLYGDLLCLMAALFYTIYLIAIGTLRERLQPMPTLALATVAGAAVAFIVSSYGEASILPGSWGPLLMLAVSSQVVGQGLLVYALGHLEPAVAGLCLLVQPVSPGGSEEGRGG